MGTQADVPAVQVDVDGDVPTLTPSRIWTVVGALTAVGLVIRLAFLDQPMRFDESMTFLLSIEEGPSDIVSDYAIPNNHILHNLLAWPLFKAVGAVTPELVRVPALVAGTALVPTVAAAARVHYDDRVAVVAAALTAGSPALVLYSTNARGYSLVALGTMAMVGLAGWIRHDGPTPLRWAALAGAAVATMYTVPAGLLAVAGVFTWLLVATWTDSAEDRRAIRTGLLLTGLAAAAVTVAAYSPVLVWGSGLESITSNRFVEAQAIGALAEDGRSTLGDVWDLWGLGLPLVLQVIGAGVVVLAFGLDGRLIRGGRSVGAVMTVTAVALVLVQRNVPFARVTTFLLPVVAMMVAAVAVAGADALARRRGRPCGPAVLPVAALAIAVALGATAWSSTGVRSDTETGSFVDAEPLVVAMTESAAGLDATLAVRWQGRMPIEFYLRDTGGSVKVAKGNVLEPGDLASGDVLFVVTRSGEDPRDALGVLAGSDATVPASASGPELVVEGDEADLYRYDLR